MVGEIQPRAPPLYNPYFSIPSTIIDNNVHPWIKVPEVLVNISKTVTTPI